MAGYSDPREALIRRAFQLQQAANHIRTERDAVLHALFDDVVAELARIDPNAPKAWRYRRDRVAKLLKRVEELTHEAFTRWHMEVRGDLARLGRAHGQNITADLVATLGDAGSAIQAAIPTQNMVKAILDATPFEGETLKGWADVQEQATLGRIRRVIQTGMMDEASIDEMVRKLRGGHGVKGVWQTTRREAEAVVRTAVTFTAVEAQKMTYAANPKVVSAVQWVSALDSRTCPICAALDGETYNAEQPENSPPAHLSCRCALVPVVNWEGLGLDPPDEGMRIAKTPDGKRAYVPESTSYEDWLKNQPASVQDEVLGPTRAKLFRDGKIRLDDLISRDNRILTLNELEAAR